MYISIHIYSCVHRYNLRVPCLATEPGPCEMTIQVQTVEKIVEVPFATRKKRPRPDPPTSLGDELLFSVCVQMRLAVVSVV